MKNLLFLIFGLNKLFIKFNYAPHIQTVFWCTKKTLELIPLDIFS